MSIWKIMNWAAWATSALLAGIMVRDFIRVEKARQSAKPDSNPSPSENDGHHKN